MNFGGMGNMQQLLKQAKAMQEKMEQDKLKLEQSEVEASSGSSLVKVKMNGKREVLSLIIDKNAVDVDDLEMLEDLIIVAINDANKQIDELAETLTPQIPNNLGGMF